MSRLSPAGPSRHFVTHATPYGRLLRGWLDDPLGLRRRFHAACLEDDAVAIPPAAADGASGAELEGVLILESRTIPLAIRCHRGAAGGRTMKARIHGAELPEPWSLIRRFLPLPSISVSRGELVIGGLPRGASPLTFSEDASSLDVMVATAAVTALFFPQIDSVDEFHLT